MIIYFNISHKTGVTIPEMQLKAQFSFKTQKKNKINEGIKNKSMKIQKYLQLLPHVESCFAALYSILSDGGQLNKINCLTY